MDIINFGSFQRSGNHFFLNVANKIFDNTKVVWFEHNCFSLRKQLNTVVTIRNPVDSVFSLCVLRGEYGNDFINDRLRLYKMYYEKINTTNSIIIPFVQLIENPIVCFEYISSKYKLNEPNISKMNISTIEGKEYSNKHIPKFLKSEILNSHYLADADKIFNKLCILV